MCLYNFLFEGMSHSVGFYPKYGHFRDKIDESFLRFFSLTLVLLDSILLLEVQFGKMNETTEKCSQARYARTISKVAIFLVKSDTVSALTMRTFFILQPFFLGLFSFRVCIIPLLWPLGFHCCSGGDASLVQPNLEKEKRRGETTLLTMKIKLGQTTLTSQLPKTIVLMVSNPKKNRI